MTNPVPAAPVPTATATDSVAELIDPYSEAWAARDPDRIAAFHAADGIFHLHSGGAEAVRGRDAIRDAFAGVLTQFPDLAFEQQELRVADWGWSVRWTMSGTLAIPLPVGGRTAEPGGSFAIDAIDMIIASSGLIDAKHTYLDWAAGLEQLGLA